MAAGDLVAEDEEVVRAVMHPYWDENLQRGTPSTFAECEVSVSRIGVLSYEQIVEIFRADHDGKPYPPDGTIKMVRCTGTIKVGRIYAECERTTPPVVVTVIDDPVEDDPTVMDNPAHALILGWDRATRSESKKITKGMAKRLLDACQWRNVP